MLGVRLPQTVPVVDDAVGVRHMPLATWRTLFLPEALRRCWTDPNALANLIECALEVGMHADVLVAAEHLSRIDPDRERRYGLAAIVLARNGHFSRAEELLDRHTSLFGETAFSLYAMADVSLSGNRRVRGRDLLSQALALDPDASRPLRLLTLEAGRDGEERVGDAVRPIAEIPGSWRAKLWLAAEIAESRDEIMDLVRDAVEQSRDEREVLSVASSVLARRGLTSALVDFIAPRYQLGRDRLACGVNLLFGFLSAGLKVPGEALLQRLEPMLEEAELGDYVGFYRTGFMSLRDAAPDEAAQGPNLELLKAMASAVRRSSEKGRRKVWQLLSDTHLLVPVTRAWIEVPLFESPWPSAPGLLEIVTGIDSEGQQVVLAFTDERTLRAWGPMRAPCVAVGVRSLLELVAEDKRCSVLVNPAGPTATELTLADIEAFLAGQKPTGVDSQIRFLAEPLRREVPKGFEKTAASYLTESGIVRDAWLFEMVDDRSGVNPAVAIEFIPEASPVDVRELLIDAPDEVKWDRRRSRRVRFIPIQEGRLADFIRAVGLRISVD